MSTNEVGNNEAPSFPHRSGRQRLVAAGSHEAAGRARRLRDDDLCVGERPGERDDSARRFRARRSTKRGSGRPTRTGQVGTPSTWCASSLAKSCRNKRRGPPASVRAAMRVIAALRFSGLPYVWATLI